MQQSKHIVIVAGEESGDLHATALVKQLFNWDPTLIISGIGGQHMQKAGVHLISDLARFGVTGFSEVIRHVVKINKAFKLIKKHLALIQPELVILVDYPGFNLRLAKYAKNVLGLKIIYYISPQIWAWKANRIEIIRQYIDKMAVILPFEKVLYQKATIPVSFVGHPLVDNMPQFGDLQALQQQLSLPQQTKIVAFLPGSRRHEIERHMPVLIATAEELSRKFPALHFVIPVAATIEMNSIKDYFANTQLNFTLIAGKAIEVAACSDCIVVASGTASLECALLTKPMCIIYKSSLLTYIAAIKLIKVKYLGLCNLLQNKMIVPELLQHDCNPQQLTKTIDSLLNDKEIIKTMIKRLKKLKKNLSVQQADESIFELIKNELTISSQIRR